MIKPLYKQRLYGERDDEYADVTKMRQHGIASIVLLKGECLLNRIVTILFSISGLVPAFAYLWIILWLYFKAVLFWNGCHKDLNRAIFGELLSGRFMLRPHNAASKTIELNMFRQVRYSPVSLELGSGNGIVSSILHKDVKLNIGSDYLPQSLPGLKKRNIFEMCLATDARSMPFSDMSLSTIIFVHGIDHIEDKSSVIQEVARVLKRNGKFAFSDVSEKWDTNLISKLFLRIGMDRCAEKYRVFRRRASLIADDILSVAQYNELLGRNGFVVKEIRYFDNMHFHQIRALMRFIDLELKPLTETWLHMFEALIRRSRLLREMYKHVVSMAFLPIIETDQELCGKEGGGNIFLIVEKCE